MITTTHTLRRASLTAGIALALMAVLAAFAVFGAISPQITPGDAERTAQDIAASQGVFRLGIAGLIVVAAIAAICLSAGSALAASILAGGVDWIRAIHLGCSAKMRSLAGKKSFGPAQRATSEAARS